MSLAAHQKILIPFTISHFPSHCFVVGGERAGGVGCGVQ